MPSPTRLAIPEPTSVSQGLKRIMSDAEAAPQDPKKARRNSSAEPSAGRDPHRDTKRRRRKKKKAPIVSIGITEDDATPSRLDVRPRAPLSTRNDIIRFTSAPPEPAGLVPAAADSSQPPPSKLFSKGREDSSHTLGNAQIESMPSTLRVKERVVPANTLSEPSSSSLEDRVAQLEVELKSKNDLLVSHQALLNQVQQAVTCQVCLDLMYKPYALAPCGHLACYSCLVNWFTAPPPDNRRGPPVLARRKTCPHCRAVVYERPAEVWSVKSIAQAVGKSGLLTNQLPVPAEDPESLNANTDPWKDIFPKPGATSYRGFPWAFPGVDVDDDDDVPGAGIPQSGEDVGMLDMEDGGIYRCLDCMHEIWDGICSSCGRFYPGHRPEGDDDDNEGDPTGWLEDQMGAEEVNVADDPGWMGLEDGEADDGGDIDEWRPFAPWRRQLHMFRGPWGFLGTIHVDEDEEEDEGAVYDQVDNLQVPGEEEDSDDEGYESSFIDDEGDLMDRPRIYEIHDDNEDERYRPIQRRRSRRAVNLVSDNHEEDEEEGTPERERAARRHSSASLDEEGDEVEDHVLPSRQRSRGQSQIWGRRVVESDSSDSYWSDS